MHLLFDLDGTLTDSRPGIVRCLQHALSELDRAAPPDAELTRYIGPPLANAFATLLDTTDPSVIDSALAAYRERYERLGMFENAVYPGVRDAITSLNAGHMLHVVTSKPTVYARRILEHFEIADVFRSVRGPELSDRQFTKGLLIQSALHEQSIQGSEAVMIGDRAEDIRGARANGVRSIGVTWGYGGRNELLAAAPDRIVDSVAELMEYLTRD